jgi:prepilin-type N-terminal cleavage/methylation domain-containing protein
MSDSVINPDVFIINRSCNNFKRKGFSLTEIVLAVALLGLVLVIVCSVFFKALMGIKRGQTGGTAMYIVSKKIDEVKSVDLGKTNGIYIKELYQHIEGYDTPAIDADKYISWISTDAVSEKTISGKEGPGGEYKFKIDVKNYYENSSSVDNLKIVIVEVTWHDSLQGKEKSLKVDTLLARKAY